MNSLKEFIDTYKDYPKKGIEFKDVLGIIQEPKIFKELIVKMASSQIIKNAEAIISIDARGFIFGSAISLQASKPMIVARKPGKLPGELVEKNYSLEYGENRLCIQKKALQKYNSYVIVDDLLATGGTVNCVSKILESNNKEVLGILVVVELFELNGRSKLNFPVETIISIWITYIDVSKFNKKYSFFNQTTPKVPAVKPTIKKNINSAKSLGIELTISLSWVI